MDGAGGMVTHTCTKNGSGGFPCRGVRITMAQGTTSWRGLGMSGANPLPFDYYSWSDGSNEIRYWPKWKTGFASNKIGVRHYGSTTVSWNFNSDRFCDVTSGNCT